MAEFKSFNEFQQELHHQVPDVELEEEIKEEEAEEKKKSHRFQFLKQLDPGGVKRYLAGTAGVIILIVGGILFLPVPFGEIRLSGNEAVSLDDVLFDGNVRQPVNVWQVSTSELKTRLEQDIRIGSAEVSRGFPFYIYVNIAERKPAAVIQEDFGYALVDKEGVVIQTVSSLRGIDLPAVTGVKLGNTLLGDTVTRENVQAALLFISSLSSAGSHAFSEVNVGNESNIVAYTREGIPVWLGQGDRMDERAALAEKMLNDMKVRHLAVEHIDASLTSPYFKTKN